jgi:hypothetical protein
MPISPPFILPLCNNGAASVPESSFCRARETAWWYAYRFKHGGIRRRYISAFSVRSHTNRTKISQNTKKKVSAPPLLVQRCNGTTAGLGYLEVLKLAIKFLLLEQLECLHCQNGGEGYNSSTDLNPNTVSSIQFLCNQAASPHLADKNTSKPQQKYCM